MFARKINATEMCCVAALGRMLSAPSMAAFTSEDAVKLEAEAIETLEKFQADTKGEEDIFSKAKSVLICPTIRKIGAGVGVEVGKCVLTTGDGNPLFYRTRGLKTGAIGGVQSHSMILVINTDEALAKFTSGKREWELGVDASVSVAPLGAGGDIDTANLKGAIVSFIFGEKGLMADLS